MRVGICCYPTYGGSGAVATELGLALARRGHEVHFISYASPFRLRGFAKARIVPEEILGWEQGALHLKDGTWLVPEGPASK